MHGKDWEPWRPGLKLPLPGLPRVIAHRGASAAAPENTLAAFRLAHERGARMVELDARLTRDGVLVAIHDSTLDRTTDGHGRVIETDSATIALLDAGSWFDPAFRGERVPTLEEALALLANLGLAVNVELKADPGQEARTGAEAARLIARVWPSDGPPVLLSSFQEETLLAARHEVPELPRGLLRERAGPDWREAMERLACTTLHLAAHHLEAPLVHELYREAVPVLAYTVNDPREAKRLFDLGVRAIFTDVPEEIASVAPPLPHSWN
ncbi:MAG: glycerophosphodiester phosphodiesterase [Geminicoccaceae bacterium]|nr:glycerophosphodiester phosphodiesterase [Geminicoccaceae bacterium]